MAGQLPAIFPLPEGIEGLWPTQSGPDASARYVGRVARLGGETRCFGKSGAITRLWKGQQLQVAEGLESHALPDGSSASGPNDISFHGTGGAYITLGLGGDGEFQEALGGKYSGSLIHMAASGKWKVIADVLQHEEDENPAGGPVDSNPFGVLAEPGGRLVVDAGADALLRVASRVAAWGHSMLVAASNPRNASRSEPTGRRGFAA